MFFETPKLTPIEGVRDICPKSGGGDKAQDPISGHLPKIITHLPKSSQYSVVSLKNETGKVKCEYALLTEFTEIRNQIEPTLQAHKSLFASFCRKNIKKGMIFPKQNYLTHVFEKVEPANILKCSEMCFNVFEKSRFNASCQSRGKFADCKPTLPHCFYWSFNIKTNFLMPDTNFLSNSIPTLQ